MKKLLTILVLIMLIISFFQITIMYALYKEQLEGEYSTLLGVWAIKVNETDISSGGQDLRFNITDSQLGYVESNYIQAGKIAPGGQSYFDIVIDPTNTDVSIIYQLNVGSDTEVGANVELVSVENYFGQGEDGQTNKTTNDETYTNGNLYTSVIPIDMITGGYKNYIRIYFEWINDEAKNQTDSTLAETDAPKISIPLEINLKQYTGEVIGSGT